MAETAESAPSNGAAGPAQTTPAAAPPDGDNLDRVRNILFGQKARDLDDRVSRSEERLMREIAELRTAVDRRVDTLEAFVKEEVASLGRRLQAESTARGDADTDLEASVADLGRSLERKIGAARDEAEAGARALRQSLLERSNELRDELSAKAAELFADIERAAADLQHRKTDRAALAALLNDVALRLSADDEG
jgi:hypothetical protein